MPEYNYLKHNESDFPHIKNVDVYKYDNAFDYGRFDYTQMELQICTVPWDMGEAHIGARTISGIGNVVYFESKENRDEWFDSIPETECYRFTTKFKELHRSNQIDVPIPFDMCAKHNYLRVEYSRLANEDSPVRFEGESGLREWFWFIREVEFLAPNTTRLHLLPDAFQTWIYDVNIQGMMLERGHAPMFAMKADEFLMDPLKNNEYLLTEDVNFGEATQVKHIDACVLNAGTMYACIATTANPKGDFGTYHNTDWNIPTLSAYNNNGLPSVYVFATSTANLSGLLSAIDSNIPQFKKTIQAVFFASKTLLSLGDSFTFCERTCYDVTSTRKTLELVDLRKSLFGYDAQYANMAKLYTDPYAHIEITDENGDTDIIKIEDSEGLINVSVSLSLAYPFLNIDSHLLGVGGNGRASVTFKNIDSRTFEMSGAWYNTLHSWNVPTFAVVQNAMTENDYSTYFDRWQAESNYDIAQRNDYARAANVTDNADLQVAANNALATVSNTSATAEAANKNGHQNEITIADVAATMSNALSTIAYNEMQGSLSAASSVATGAIGSLGISSGASGMPNIGISGMANAIIGSATTLASTAIGNGQTLSQAAITNGANNAHYAAVEHTNDASRDIQITATNDSTTAHNTLTSGVAANNSALIIDNADRNAWNAQFAIDNQIRQSGLNEPFMFGNFANGESAANKPIGLFAHIVTQSKSAISSAGDEFARYGYQFDKYWDFDGNWNIGKYFTYWKLRDFWVSNLNVPDMYMDRLRFFLYGGVTIWRKPEDIGHISLYDNFK